MATVWVLEEARKPTLRIMKLNAEAVMTKATSMMAVSMPVIPYRLSRLLIFFNYYSFLYLYSDLIIHDRESSDINQIVRLDN